jgi:hypothetical protein
MGESAFGAGKAVLTLFSRFLGETAEKWGP